MSSYPTSCQFTHNAWISDDNNYLFTTDETAGCYVGAYDVSDIYDIQEIDLIQENGGARIDQLQSIKDPLPNENFILRNGEKSILVTFDPFQEKAVQINTQTAYGIIPRNAEQSFALNVLMNDKIQLVTLTGKAGTGKSFDDI